MKKHIIYKFFGYCIFFIGVLSIIMLNNINSVPYPTLQILISTLLTLGGFFNILDNNKIFFLLMTALLYVLAIVSEILLALSLEEPISYEIFILIFIPLLISVMRIRTLKKSYYEKEEKVSSSQLTDFDLDLISDMLHYSDDLINTINETKNSNEFEKSLLKLKDILTYLSQFEDTDIFKNALPSEELQRITEWSNKHREDFRKNPSINRRCRPSPIITNAKRPLSDSDLVTFAKACNQYLRKQDFLEEQRKEDENITPDIAYKTPTEEQDTQQSTDFDSLEGHDFELYCANLLKKNGFHHTLVTKESGDQGIDILAEKEGIKYAIQCKCYSSDIGNKAVQEAFAGKTFYGCHVAVVLTNRYFTRSAKELAEKNGVLLWDRNKLVSLIHNTQHMN